MKLPRREYRCSGIVENAQREKTAIFVALLSIFVGILCKIGLTIKAANSWLGYQ